MMISGRRAKLTLMKMQNTHFGNSIKGRFFSKGKYEKNTKFKEDLYKYPHEPYVDNVNLRPDLYLKGDDAEEGEGKDISNGGIKRTHDRRLKRNFPLVYSNEVENLEELKTNPFTLVNIKTKNNESLGVATFNPYSLITARVLSHNALFSINIHFFIEKIKESLSWRNRINKGKTNNLGTPTSTDTTDFTLKDDHSYGLPTSDNRYRLLRGDRCYRLLNGEGDGVPGLLIDRYDSFLSVQHLTVGCEMLACNISDALIELLNPEAIIFRNDNKERLNEKLEIYKKVFYGKVPEQVMLKENDCFFLIDLLNSPNTGWYFNRKSVRNLLCTYAYKKKVLDLFSYVGSFGIQCAKIGKAKKVVCVDKQPNFVELAKKSAYLNGIKNNIEFVCDDFLHFFQNCDELFDIIILDPPNLIPKSKFLESGSKRYTDLIHLAQKYINPNGLLLIIFTTKLCSYQNYISIINKSFVHTNKHVKIVGQGRASPDHPVNLSLYLVSDFYWFALQLSY
ncbi:conserved Plasmodium protein, unknown function [Plasmodium ovale]|uniref:Uncharacterized protein n=1 Tax=Plasmodium ovale TaxID=36330 RepID=A0A1D3UAU2_PLAOA|nr:conserved Plasmodium protein, unknown function [Plasmodium ovale]